MPLSPIGSRPTIPFGTPKQSVGIPQFYSPGPRQPLFNNIRSSPSPLHPQCPSAPLLNSPLPLHYPVQNPSSPPHSNSNNNSYQRTPLPSSFKKNLASPPTNHPALPVNHPTLNAAQTPSAPHAAPQTTPKPLFVPKVKENTSTPTLPQAAPPAKVVPPSPVVADAKKCVLTPTSSSVHKPLRLSPTNKENKVNPLSLSPLPLKENNINNKNNNLQVNATPNNKQPLPPPQSHSKPQGTLSPFKAKQQLNQVASNASKAVAETPVKVKSQPQQQSVPVTPVQTPVAVRSAENTGDGATPGESPTKSSPSSPSKCETDPHRLQQRQKQVDYGYRTLGYVRYRLNVPIESRDLEQPKTPRKAQCCSKRSWDGQVKKWRRDLHKWDPTDPVEFETLTDHKVLATIFSNPDEIPLVLKQLEEQILELKQTGTLKEKTEATDEDTTEQQQPPKPKIDVTNATRLIERPDTDDFVGEEDTIQSKLSTVRMLVF